MESCKLSTEASAHSRTDCTRYRRMHKCEYAHAEMRTISHGYMHVYIGRSKYVHCVSIIYILYRPIHIITLREM